MTKKQKNIIKATDITWLAKKQFIISYEDTSSSQPIFEFLEIISDKVFISFLFVLLFKIFARF